MREGSFEYYFAKIGGALLAMFISYFNFAEYDNLTRVMLLIVHAFLGWGYVFYTIAKFIVHDFVAGV